MKVKKALIILGVVSALLVGGLLYLGGYWENLPLLDRISGPLRFKQFVLFPPACVHSIRKGYSGFPQGMVATHFKYQGSLETCRFLHGWSRAEIDPSVAYGSVLHPPEGNWSKIYKKDGAGKIYLLIRESSQEGLLFVP